MSAKYSLFSYKSGNSLLHKCPAWCKILFIPIINIVFLCLPPYFAVGFVLLQFILACCLKFSPGEQLADLKPIIYYAVLLFVVKIISLIFGYFFPGAGDVGIGVAASAEIAAVGVAAASGVSSAVGAASAASGGIAAASGVHAVSAASAGTFFEYLKFNFTWQSEKASVFMLIKLFAVMQSASLLFKTSTSLELREGIEKIELFVRKIFHQKQEAKLTDAFSMFLNFIPMVAKIWNQSKKAWIARGGKHNLKMYSVLLPVLFSVGMKKAYNHTKAVIIRK